MGQYAFVHFGPNTFTDQEWGGGKEDPNLFNPTAFDARQWARAVKAGGLKGIILTAKHHDGFCLWPSKLSTHTVAQSPFQGGKGDVVKSVSDACRAEGLKFGVYLSPWDRNHPSYGTPEYNRVFAGMLKEVLTHYGPVFEVWFDGANGEGPNGKKQVYDWDLFIRIVRECQPNAVIFSDAGPDIRWIGNEGGYAAPTNWATIDRNRYRPGTPLYQELTEGKRGGADWVPAECDVSIRPGWFYHKDQDDKVKSPAQLLDLWERSVGQNSNFLLNVPPDRRGLIADPDIAALKGFAKLREEIYGHDLAKSAKCGASVGKMAKDGWSAPEGVRTADLTVALPKPTRFDRIELREPIEDGQRIAAFTVEARNGSRWSEIAEGTTVGNRRILRVPPTDADAVRVRIKDALAPPKLLPVALFVTPQGKAAETKAQRDARLAWWREARFGMFIHWGLYAIPAGEWNGVKYGGGVEWIMNMAKIPVNDYEPLAKQWNPTKFDAREWVRVAKNAGMKYIVITSKHHEGFGLWPSKQGDWNVKRTPFKDRDVLKELAAACKEAGIRLCFYHSIMDWHHPDYLPKRPWDREGESKANFDRYVAYMKAQLKELLTNYGDIGILWFDGEWEGTWTSERGQDLYNFVRSIQSKIIVNNRVSKGRNGMQGMTEGQDAGDYGTPEQEIPANGLPGIDWESCMTMNDTWGYSAHDHNWKSAQTLVRNLIDCASKGGNYLLNVGPKADGLMPEESVDRLRQVGEWMKQYGGAIYGTSAGPFPKPLPWGRVTRKGNHLYLHVFDAGSHVLLPGLQADVVSVKEMSGRTPAVVGRTASGGANAIAAGQFRSPQNVPFKKTDEGVELDLTGLPRAAFATVYDMTVRGPVEVVQTNPKQAADGSIDLLADDADVHGATAHLEGDKHAIGYWTDQKDTVGWTFDAVRGEVNVEIEYACDNDSAGSEFAIEVGGQTLRGKVESTGSWSTFHRVKLGKVAIVTPGKTELVVRPLTKPGLGVMNLRAVRLRP
jgi:alpha-L-fucosidase